MNIEPRFSGEHPGLVLKRALGKPSPTAIARYLKTSRQRVAPILAGDAAISVVMALKIGRLTDTPPELWLRLQAEHDLAQLRRRKRLVAELETIAAL